MADEANLGDVSARLSIKTEEFNAKLAASADNVDKLARATERAADRARAAWEREVLAQEKVAAKTAELARTKELAALKSDILARSEEQLAEKAQRSEQAFTQLMQALNRAGLVAQETTVQNTRLAASMEMVNTAAGHTVPSMAAASGALRLLEGGMGGSIRAAERFISTTLGLGPILEAAFPVVGAIALIGALVKVGEEVYKAEENFIHLKSAIDAISHVQITVDAGLGRLNDQVEEKVESILEKTQGKGAALQQKYKYEGSKPADLSNFFYDDGIKKLPDDVKGNYETLYKAVAPGDLPERLSKIKAEVIALNHALQDSNSAANFGVAVKKVGDFGPNANRDPRQYYAARLQLAQQIQSQLQAQSDLKGASAQATSTDITDQGKKDADEASRKQEEARNKGLAALRKAAEEQMKAMDTSLAARRMDHQVSTAEEYTFWEDMLRPASAYADSYRKVQEKLGELMQKMYHEDEEALKKFDEANKRSAEQTKQWYDLAERLNAKMDAEQEKSANYQALMADVQRENAVALNEQALAFAVATGAMSKHDAKVQEAALHAAKYASELQKLDDQQRNDDDNGSLDPGEREERKRQRDVERTKIRGRAQLTGNADAQAVQKETAMGGFHDAINEFIVSVTDAAGEMKRFTSEGLRGFNDTLLKLMTGRTGRGGAGRAFQDLGSNLFSSASGSLLQYGEGNLLQRLGVGQGDGHGPANFFAKHGGGFGSLLASLLGGSAASRLAGAQASAAGAGSIDTIGSALTSLIPGFASGTPDFGGGMAMVGELGPEIVNLPPHSSVIPNSRIGSAGGGGGGGHHFDFSGANFGGADPEMIMRRVTLAVNEARKAAVKDSVHAVRESGERRPR